MSALVTVFFIVAIYLMPTMFAASHKHHNTMAIFVINLFLGWTLVGWVVALAWAFTKPAQGRAA